MTDHKNDDIRLREQAWIKVLPSYLFMFNMVEPTDIKVGLSPFKKVFVICFIESPVKTIKMLFISS